MDLSWLAFQRRKVSLPEFSEEEPVSLLWKGERRRFFSLKSPPLGEEF